MMGNKTHIGNRTPCKSVMMQIWPPWMQAPTSVVTIDDLGDADSAIVHAGCKFNSRHDWHPWPTTIKNSWLDMIQ